MFIRSFERTDRYGNYEVIDIGPYAYSIYRNGLLERTECVENLEEDIKSILYSGFTEIH